MKISSRFTVAIHTLLCIDTFAADNKVTSEFIAGSVHVNPVVIRRTLGQLKQAGMVDMVRGSGGAMLVRSLSDVTLLDVYRAVDCVEEDSLFNFHSDPNPACPVGRNIHRVLDGRLTEAQRVLEDKLRETKLSDIAADLAELMK